MEEREESKVGEQQHPPRLCICPDCVVRVFADGYRMGQIAQKQEQQVERIMDQLRAWALLKG